MCLRFFNNSGGNAWFLSRFFLSSPCICSYISLFSTYENEKENFCDLLHASPIVSMLEWFLYLRMSFKIGSLMLITIESKSLYSGILRLVTILEKKFKIQNMTVSCSVWITSPSSIKVILSVDIILSERDGFIIFHKILLYLSCCNHLFPSFL